MNSATIRRVLTFVLLACLLVGLILFCVLFIMAKNSNAEQNKKRNNPTMEEIRQTTEHDYGHHHTVTATTATTTAETTTSPDDQGSEYEIKLKGGNEGVSGKVLIEYNGTTGFVCNDDFDNKDALVVCKELGYRQALSYRLSPFNPPSYRKYTRLEPVLTGLQCTGNEKKLSDCAGFELRRNTTSCTWFAAVLCYNDKPYELRLVGGIHLNSGMVEMKVGGVWGLFCAIRNFDDDVADILCRSMNYTGGFTLDRGMLGEASRSKIWVPYISCGGHVDSVELIHSIFECDMVLNTENIAYNLLDHRSNRYRNEYMACENKPNSYAAAVQCLI